MRANTFAGEVIAVLSRRAPAFQLKPTEPQTLPGRILALLRPRKRTASASPTASTFSQALAPEESHAQADLRLASAYVELASGGGGLGSESVALGLGYNLDGLVDAAVGDSQQAVDGVLRWIRPLVVRYCNARIGRQESPFASADEVAEEVCLAVLTALPSYRDQGRPFLAFVYGIAARKVAEVRSSAARNRVVPLPAIPDSPADLVDGPEQQVMLAELAEGMTKLLDTLQAKEREIIILRIVIGLSAEDTADAMGLTPGAVRVAQHRALGKLRKTLESGRTI